MVTTAGRAAVSHASSRAALLDAVRAAGLISRVELARVTGLTNATVSTAVRGLLDEGLVIEAGRAQSTGGKPATLLSLNSEARFAIGVHLDRDGTTYSIANLGGELVGRWRRPGIGDASPHRVVERIGVEVDQLVERTAVARSTLLGVGVVSPGPLTASLGMVLTSPSMAAWEDFPLAEALADRVGLGVLLENDATAAAIGEYWTGGATDGAAFAALYMGRGIGAGVIVNGEVYRGASGNAAEIGHTCIVVDGPTCWCGARGCLEVVAGPGAVVAAARAAGLDLPGRSLARQFGGLVRAARAGDDTAASLIAASASLVSVAAQSLANLFDLEEIVLTGPAFAQAGEAYLPAIRERLARVAFARKVHTTEVTVSARALESAAIGAAALVLQSELAPRRPWTSSGAGRSAARHRGR